MILLSCSTNKWLFWQFLRLFSFLIYHHSCFHRGSRFKVLLTHEVEDPGDHGTKEGKNNSEAIDELKFNAMVDLVVEISLCFFITAPSFF